MIFEAFEKCLATLSPIIEGFGSKDELLAHLLWYTFKTDFNSRSESTQQQPSQPAPEYFTTSFSPYLCAGV